MVMNSEGAKTWSRVTGANIGERIAIVLDGKVHMAPNIREKIPGGRTQIEGFEDMNEAKDIAIILRAGALPAPIEIIEERSLLTEGSELYDKVILNALYGQNPEDKSVPTTEVLNTSTKNSN